MEWFEDVAKDREFLVLPQIVGDNEFGVFNNTCRAACIALTERYMNLKIDGVLTKPIKPRKGIFNSDTMRDYRNVLARACYGTPVLSRQQVVDLYTGAKQRLYQQACDSLAHTPLTEADWMLKTFIKFEKCNVSKAPRIINPRSTRYTLELARYLKKIEKSIYRGINKVFGSRTQHTVIKGLNVVETANVIKEKWDLFVDPVFIGGDITKLDMHIGIDALKMEHSTYNQVFRSRRLKWLLTKQLLNKGTAWFPDGKVSFKMIGTRSSGDINTSTGNAIIVCGVLNDAVKHLQIFVEVIDNGDDFGLIVERSDMQKVVQFLPTHFEQYGFRLTMEEPVDEFENIEFCQTKPVFDGSVWRMCRLPMTIFKKDTICTMPVHTEKVWREWLMAVGDGGVSLTRGLPVLPNFYRAYQRSGVKCRASIEQQTFRNSGHWQRSNNICDFDDLVSDEARVSFYKAFNITPDEQRDLERYFDTLEIDASETLYLGSIRDNNLIHPSRLLCSTETTAALGGPMGSSRLV